MFMHGFGYINFELCGWKRKVKSIHNFPTVAYKVLMLVFPCKCMLLSEVNAYSHKFRNNYCCRGTGDLAVFNERIVVQRIVNKVFG